MMADQNLKLELEPSESQRLRLLKAKLDAADSGLRSLQGRAASRRSLPVPDPNPLLAEIAALEDAIFALLGRDLALPTGPALRELEDKLRQQALAYFQKSRVDPQLWKDLASS